MDKLTKTLQSTVNMAAKLASAARNGAPSSTLDDLAGKVIQHAGAFRVALRNKIVHWHSCCAELEYVGAACLGEGPTTTDPKLVTCDKCAKDMNRPVEPRE
jgi:hypothetical protein